jgi:AbiV family abortive infection protein
MSKKTFITLSKKECLEVYTDMVQNSNKKWQSGIKLAENNDFGSAISLAIISNEELIKALIVFFDGNGFRLRSIKGINALFKNHQLRYLIAYVMFAMGSFINDFTNLINEFRKDPSLINAWINVSSDKRFEFETWLIDYLKEKFNSLGIEFNWFSNIDRYRQDGLYCDYNNNLKNPIDISKQEYQFAFYRLELVRRIGISFFESINDENLAMQDVLCSIKDGLIKNDFYNKASKIFSSLRNIKENPFDTIKNFIMERDDMKDILSSFQRISPKNEIINDNC